MYYDLWFGGCSRASTSKQVEHERLPPKPRTSAPVWVPPIDRRRKHNVIWI